MIIVQLITSHHHAKQSRIFKYMSYYIIPSTNSPLTIRL